MKLFLFRVQSTVEKVQAHTEILFLFQNKIHNILAIKSDGRFYLKYQFFKKKYSSINVVPHIIGGFRLFNVNHHDITPENLYIYLKNSLQLFIKYRPVAVKYTDN